MALAVHYCAVLLFGETVKVRLTNPVRFIAIVVGLVTYLVLGSGHEAAAFILGATIGSISFEKRA
jgi:hypothetical protein